MAIYAPQMAMQGRPGTGDPAFQRRQMLARQLMAQQAQTGPVHSWGEALARALTPAVTAWGAKDEERQAQARDDAFSKDYSDVVKNWQAGGSTQALAALLAGHTNKDVAALAPGQVIEDAKMQREATLRGEDRAWRQAEADKDRAIAAQRHAESIALQRAAAARAGQGSYSNPVEVMGPDNKPMLVRFNSRGGPPIDAATGRPVQGFTMPQQPPAAPGGPFQGNAMDAQAYNIIVRGQQDPALRATPEYAAAWSKVFAPRQVYNETSGQLVTIRPEVPQGFQGPGAQNVPQGAPAPAADGFVMQPEQRAEAPAAAPPAAQPAPAMAQAPNASIQQVAPPKPSQADMSKVRQIEAEAGTLKASLDEFRNLVKSTSTIDFLSAATFPNAGGARLNSAWTNAALMAKAEALFNLGVLNGPDLDILRRSLTDPSTLKGAVTSRDAYLAQIDQFEKLINSRIESFKRAYGFQGQGGAAAPAADLPPPPPGFRPVGP